MRLERLALKGLSNAFPDAVDLPLADLPPGLVAVVGPNGHGKTMLLEATPAAIYRQLPARAGNDPLTYVIGRDSYIDETFTVDGRGTFRARLNLDGPKRTSDAVLEQILPDGTHVALNDGKRSTFDAAIKERFCSFDLFINSAFAAQGRGDEFTRRKPSQRKDLFVEFLALQHYAVKAQAAATAAELYADARLRLTAVVEQLERETAPAFFETIDQQANALQATGGAAEVSERELAARIGDLDAQLARLADQVATNAAATARVTALEREIAVRQHDVDALTTERTTLDNRLAADLERFNTKRTATVQRAELQAATERTRLEAKRDAEVADADTRIAGNEQILGMAAAIRSAVADLAVLEQALQGQRADVSERRAELRQAETQLRDAEKALAALVPIEDALGRAVRDASTMESVPCHGNGPYAACRFLTDAAAARDQVAGLRASLGPKVAIADHLAEWVRHVERLTAAVAALDDAIATATRRQAELQQHAKYAEPLKEAEARIDGYKTAKAKAIADALEQRAQLQVATADAIRAAEQDQREQAADARAQHEARVTALTAQHTALEATLQRLVGELADARAEQAATADANRQSIGLRLQVETCSRDRDAAVRAVATAESGRQELQRRREELAAKRARLEDLRGRRARIEQDWLEWKDLAKALGKGGLPDLEIDQAGPTISATTNAILLDCFGPRFSIELVTQVEKADGSGVKDEFTVRVMDNARAGGWRDISDLSGGQKVIVQEALMCAISLYVNERSPMPIRTLWRDETGAGLDPENALAYVRMLRKVRELGGYHHVFFISHNPDAAALADAQIVVGDGQARIVLPPFSEAA